MPITTHLESQLTLQKGQHYKRDSLVTNQAASSPGIRSQLYSSYAIPLLQCFRPNVRCGAIEEGLLVGVNNSGQIQRSMSNALHKNNQLGSQNNTQQLSPIRFKSKSHQNGPSKNQWNPLGTEQNSQKTLSPHHYSPPSFIPYQPHSNALPLNTMTSHHVENVWGRYYMFRGLAVGDQSDQGNTVNTHYDGGPQINTFHKQEPNHKPMSPSHQPYQPQQSHPLSLSPSKSLSISRAISLSLASNKKDLGNNNSKEQHSYRIRSIGVIKEKYYASKGRSYSQNNQQNSDSRTQLTAPYGESALNNNNTHINRHKNTNRPKKTSNLISNHNQQSTQSHNKLIESKIAIKSNNTISSKNIQRNSNYSPTLINSPNKVVKNSSFINMPTLIKNSNIKNKYNNTPLPLSQISQSLPLQAPQLPQLHQLPQSPQLHQLSQSPQVIHPSSFHHPPPFRFSNLSIITNWSNCAKILLLAIGLGWIDGKWNNGENGNTYQRAKAKIQKENEKGGSKGNRIEQDESPSTNTININQFIINLAEQKTKPQLDEITKRKIRQRKLRTTTNTVSSWKSSLQKKQQEGRSRRTLKPSNKVVQGRRGIRILGQTTTNTLQLLQYLSFNYYLGSQLLYFNLLKLMTHSPNKDLIIQVALILGEAAKIEKWANLTYTTHQPTKDPPEQQLSPEESLAHFLNSYFLPVCAGMTDSSWTIDRQFYSTVQDIGKLYEVGKSFKITLPQATAQQISKNKKTTQETNTYHYDNDKVGIEHVHLVSSMPSCAPSRLSLFEEVLFSPLTTCKAKVPLGYRFWKEQIIDMRNCHFEVGPQVPLDVNANSHNSQPSDSDSDSSSDTQQPIKPKNIQNLQPKPPKHTIPAFLAFSVSLNMIAVSTICLLPSVSLLVVFWDCPKGLISQELGKMGKWVERRTKGNGVDVESIMERKMITDEATKLLKAQARDKIISQTGHYH